MPDLVRYVYRYELLTTFLGAVAAPLLISDSDFGSEQIVPARWDHLVPRAGTGAAAAAPVPALHPCITYAFLHEKHSKFKSITRVQIAPRFLDWNTVLDKSIRRLVHSAAGVRELKISMYLKLCEHIH